MSTTGWIILIVVLLVVSAASASTGGVRAERGLGVNRAHPDPSFGAIGCGAPEHLRDSRHVFARGRKAPRVSRERGPHHRSGRWPLTSDKPPMISSGGGHKASAEKDGVSKPQ